MILAIPQVDIPEMLQHWEWFGEWSIGCVGILGDWVVETVRSVCKAGGTTLTIAELTKHALKPDQRLRLETEARTGEFKIKQAKARSEQELQQLLGKAQALPKDFPSSPPAESASPPKPSVPLPRAPKRVGRASHRDPVGNEVQTTQPEQNGKCPFIGPIGVTVQQFQESGIWCVECPTCGARRTMKEIRDRQRFPWHPARKTPPSKGESRWTFREQTWVSGKSNPEKHILLFQEINGSHFEEISGSQPPLILFVVEKRGQKAQVKQRHSPEKITPSSDTST